MKLGNREKNWLRVLFGLRQRCEMEGCHDEATGYIHIPGFHRVLCEKHAQAFSRAVLDTYRDVIR